MLRWRVLLTVIGQGLSSASNLVLQLLFIATLSLADFGWVVIGMAGMQLANAVGRIGTGDVLIAQRDGVRPTSEWFNRRLVTIGAVSAVFLFGLAGLIGTGPALVPILVLGAASIPLALLDGARYRQWADDRPTHVIAIDSLWLAITVVACGVTALTGQLTATVVAIAWVGGGIAGLGVSRIRGWLHDRSDEHDDAPATAMGRSLLMAELPNVAAVHMVPIIIAVLIDSSAAGTYRTILLPFMVAETALLAVRVTTLGSLNPDTDGASSERGDSLRFATILHGGAAIGLVAATALALATPLRQLLGDAVNETQWLLAVTIAGCVIVARALVRPTVDWVAMRLPLRTTARVRTTLSAIELVLVAFAAVSGLVAILSVRLLVNLGAAAVWRSLRKDQRPGDNTSVRSVRSTIRTSNAND